MDKPPRKLPVENPFPPLPLFHSYMLSAGIIFIVMCVFTQIKDIIGLPTMTRDEGADVDAGMHAVRAGDQEGEEGKERETTR